MGSTGALPAAAVAVALLGGTGTAAATPQACTSPDIVQCAWPGPPSPAELNVMRDYAFANLTDPRVPLGSVLTAIRGTCSMLAGGVSADDTATQISRVTGLTNQWSDQLLQAARQADCANLPG